MITAGKRTVLAKTCPGCGCLKQNSEFGRVEKVYLHTNCKKCMTAYNNVRNNKRNDDTRKVAGHHRQPWGNEELKQLFELLDAGYTYNKIALKLGRTETACRGTYKRYSS